MLQAARRRSEQLDGEILTSNALIGDLSTRVSAREAEAIKFSCKAADFQALGCGATGKTLLETVGELKKSTQAARREARTAFLERCAAFQEAFDPEHIHQRKVRKFLKRLASFI